MENVRCNDNDRGPAMLNFIPPPKGDPNANPIRKNYSEFIPKKPNKEKKEYKKRKRGVESYPDEGEMAQYQRHRREGCECCSLHSIFTEQGRDLQSIH